MHKPKKPLAYTPDQIPSRTSWKMPIHVPRREVPNLCDGLRYMMTELAGATFYYPDQNLEKSTCRYEWHTKSPGEEFATKLGICFDVGDSSLEALEAYTAYGHGHPAEGRVPTFGSRQLSKYERMIKRVVAEALARRAPDSRKPYHVVYFIEPPPFGGTKESISVPQQGLTMLPTVIVGDEHKRVSAVAHTVPASFLAEAKELALRRHMMLCALLTLARGVPYLQAFVQWPKGRKPTESLETIDRIPGPEVVYSKVRWWPCNDRGDENFGRRLKTILDLYYGARAGVCSDLENSILAYYAAKEIQAKQPTMAIVALLAALGPMARPVKCHGEVVCSDCGLLSDRLGGRFQHNKVGDKEAVVRFVGKLLEVEDGSELYRSIDSCVTRSYSGQRSAFVHSAVLRHEEYQQRGSAIAAQPTEEHPYSEAMIYRHDLYAMDYVARRALLSAMAQRSAVALDEELFDVRRRGLQPAVSMAMSVTLPPRVPVGIIGHSGDSGSATP